MEYFSFLFQTTRKQEKENQKQKMSAALASHFSEGNPIDGKNYILKFKSSKSMGSDKNRLQLADSKGEAVSNIIVMASAWDQKPIKVGQSIRIFLAKNLTLKNGRPAYLLRDWEVVEGSGGDGSGVKKQNKPLGFLGLEMDLI